MINDLFPIEIILLLDNTIFDENIGQGNTIIINYSPAFDQETLFCWLKQNREFFVDSRIQQELLLQNDWIKGNISISIDTLHVDASLDPRASVESRWTMFEH